MTNDESELFREIFIIRPTTTTRPPFTITVSQRVADNGDIAMSTAIFSRPLDVYYEKPDMLRDAANKMIAAAELMDKLNKKVRNGK